MANITYYKGTKKLVVSEMSARLSPPEKSGWSRTEGKEVAKVPEVTKKFMDNVTPEIKVQPLPFLAGEDTPPEQVLNTEAGPAAQDEAPKPSLAPRPGSKVAPKAKPGRKPNKKAAK